MAAALTKGECRVAHFDELKILSAFRIAVSVYFRV